MSVFPKADTSQSQKLYLYFFSLPEPKAHKVSL